MRILWLKTELLHPVNRGGRIRTYQMLRALKQNHDITYLTLDDGTGAPDAPALAAEYCHRLDRVPFRTTPKDSPRLFADLALNLASPLPYAIAKYASGEMRRRLEGYVQRGETDIVVCDFLAPSQNVPAKLAAPTLLFQHNVEAEIWRRHTEIAQSAARRAYFGMQWRRMKRFEAQECQRFEQVVAVSEADARTMAQRYGIEDCAWVPTGVDVEYFRSSPERDRAPHRMVFTGALDWMPNEDAILFFATSILPVVRQSIGNAELVVVGRNPPERLRALAASTPGLILVGEVPDVRPHMDAASIFVVPMRIGGGTRLKIYEAMAMELPVVSTTVGAEGLPVTHGEHVLLEDDPGAFATALIGLMRDPPGALAMGRRACAHVRAHFGWDVVAQRFGAICEQALQTGGRTASPPPRPHPVST